MPERYIGKSLGKYRIDAIVGSGGFAWVYKAYDPELEIPVALKILKPQYAGDESFESRFRREASTAARLRHPNIIKIYAVGKEGDGVYFAMDYLSQGLADRLSVMSALPESMLMRMAIDVASALGFAHREGVIHRDIKTDNILFDDHGNGIVADFGIARAVSGYAQQTGTNMVVGTPQYFSPEQARGLQLDGRADLYSLGVTLFKAATGSLPFTGEDWYEIARQHVEERPPRPRTLNPLLSKEVEDVILRCLEKDPADRYQSGEEMCEDLLHLLQERGETASILTMVVPPPQTLSSPRSAPRLRRRLKKVQRRWWVVGALAAVLLVGFVSQVGRNHASEIPLSAADSARVARSGGFFGSSSEPPPPPPRQMLSVTLPAAAELLINGEPVGRGNWSSDTLAPGVYALQASVRSNPICDYATVRDTARIALNDTATVRLDPKGCGQLTISSTAARATYVLRSRVPGNPNRQGALPVGSPLLLPEGIYELVINAPFCTEYRDPTLRIRAGEHERKINIPLFCEQRRR